MKNNQKGIIQLLLVIGIVAVLTFIGYLLYTQNMQKQKISVSAVPSPYQVQYQKAGDEVAPVKDSSDLTSVDATLDATDITELDTSLNALGSATAGF
ncbi:MAG: hypothetical protein HYV90_02250 [Candidatus Woesebacteria bacterium]|nr:MAG: hypothetical protein HYV90_02250 [Candidatus Woesebacteria bacterium]